jgi:hypothetical protein
MGFEVTYFFKKYQRGRNEWNKPIVLQDRPLQPCVKRGRELHYDSILCDVICVENNKRFIK